MLPKRDEIFATAMDDLNQASEILVRCAQELRGVATGIETEKPELLRLQAVGIGLEATRAALAALTARGVADRLSLVSRIDTDQEAMDD